jgi:hypothetical protein
VGDCHRAVYEEFEMNAPIAGVSHAWMAVVDLMSIFMKIIFLSSFLLEALQ